MVWALRQLPAPLPEKPRLWNRADNTIQFPIFAAGRQAKSQTSKQHFLPPHPQETGTVRSWKSQDGLSWKEPWRSPHSTPLYWTRFLSPLQQWTGCFAAGWIVIQIHPPVQPRFFQNLHHHHSWEPASAQTGRRTPLQFIPHSYPTNTELIWLPRNSSCLLTPSLDKGTPRSYTLSRGVRGSGYTAGKNSDCRGVKHSPGGTSASPKWCWFKQGHKEGLKKADGICRAGVKHPWHLK